MTLALLEVVVALLVTVVADCTGEYAFLLKPGEGGEDNGGVALVAKPAPVPTLPTDADAVELE